MNKKDLEEAIKYEADQSIPVSASDLYLDWEILGEKEEKYTIFLAAAPKSIVDSYIQLTKALEMEPLAFELSLTAIARSVISTKEAAEPVILLDMGGQTTNMAVYDTVITVTESHPVGGSSIKAKLMGEQGLPEKEAESAIKNAFKNTDANSEVVKGELEKLAVEVVKLKDYFLEKNPHSKLEKILICGGVAYIPGLTDFFEKKTGIKTQPGSPWTNISIYPLKPVPKEESLSYAAAIGLCLRGFEDE